ncbi:MAG: small basic family protein [Fimbriimonadaceae bacterium]|nr:small basic family protein [Fimbriimonadaceae bacterium]
MIVVPILALVVGILLGALLTDLVPKELQPYLGLMVIAGLDSVFGGWRSSMEGKFTTDVFVTGFVSNIVIALGLGFLGDRIGISLFLAAAVVMGMRIFNNLSSIRRIALTRIGDRAKRRKMEAEMQSQQQATEA